MGHWVRPQFRVRALQDLEAWLDSADPDPNRIQSQVRRWLEWSSPNTDLSDALGMYADAVIGGALELKLPVGRIRHEVYQDIRDGAAWMFIWSCFELCQQVGWIPRWGPCHLAEPALVFAFLGQHDAWARNIRGPSILRCRAAGPDQPPVSERDMFLFAGFQSVKEGFCIQYDWDAMVANVRRSRSEHEGYEVMHPPGWRRGTAVDDPIPVKARAEAVIESYRLTEYMGLECLYRRKDGKLVLGWRQARDAYNREYRVPRKRKRVKGDRTLNLDSPSQGESNENESILEIASAQKAMERFRWEREAPLARDQVERLLEIADQFPLLHKYLEPDRISKLGLDMESLEKRLVGIDAAVGDEPDVSRKAALVYAFGRWHPTGKVWKQPELAVEFGTNVKMISRHSTWAEAELTRRGLI